MCVLEPTLSALSLSLSLILGMMMERAPGSGYGYEHQEESIITFETILNNSVSQFDQFVLSQL